MSNNGRKRFTEEWFNEIYDPISLATWFMDDGSAQKYSIDFSTGSATIDELIIASNWLDSNWGIESRAVLLKTRPAGRLPQTKLYINKQKFRDIFYTLVKPYIVSSMKYKIRFSS